MKKLTTFLTLLLCAVTLLAQSPEKFTYQAVVRNASNTLVSNTLVGVRVSILQGSATGNGVYVETQMPSTNANGLITLNIGDGNVVFGSFDGIDWSAGPFFLKTEIDPNGGNNYSVTSTQQLLSVPYALYAKESGNGFSGDYNDLTNLPQIPQIPADVSAFTNDAGYMTSYTETDPTVPAWAKEATKPAYDYSEIANTPVIPTVPTNVSAFTNDAGYLTGYTETDPVFSAWNKDYNDLINKPTIPTIPSNVSAFTNDAGYLTNYTETDPQFNAWDKDYNDLINKPVIPTVPTNVSAFANDANYVTTSQLNAANYITAAQIPAQVSADWNATTGAAQILNKPTLFSGNYNDLTNKPTIPTVPTNVSTFINDAGYLTDYTETDPQFNAWDKDYNDLTNKPVIPTVPSNVSAFTNDAGYITMDSVPAIPSAVSAFTNDAGYLTSYTETDPNVPAWAKEATKPAYDYTEIANTPTIPTVPTDVSAFNNDAGYITSSDIPEIPTVPTNVSAFTNDAGYLTSYSEQQTLADVTANGNSAGNRQLKGVSDPTENLDAVNLRTLVSQMNSLQDNFQQQMQQMQQQMEQQMEQMQQQIDSLQDIVNSLDTNHHSTAGGAVVDEKSCPGTPTVTDHEGNVYATVQIGNQCWMRDNLRTTTSPTTGTYLIPAAGTTYTYTGKQAFWYNNDSTTYAPMNYGLLYNWNAAVDTFNTAYGETSVNTDFNNAVSVSFTGHRRGICPVGWHLPSDAEWTAMTNYVSSQSEYTCGGNSSYIAKALASETGWNSYSWKCYPGDQSVYANNATGFSAVPAGHGAGSPFGRAGDRAYFWSSSQNESYSDNAYNRNLYYNRAYVTRYNNFKYIGFSVRCLRD